MSEWQDMIVGARMQVDEEFSAQVDQSPLPELEKVSEMGPMGQPQESDGGGGLLGSLLGSLGLGGDEDDGPNEEKVSAAESMVTAYADELQVHLEEEGRWGEVRAAAAAELEE
ncbi:hypothetical protein BRC84_06510 [Halobacteriales archaeon QS_1_68_44]|nr:MAG: hypothetical protein BRC84_06510 [Halobacteriales archaeon QS_1_68_44]